MTDQDMEKKLDYVARQLGKPMREFIQLDGWADHAVDSYADDDGDLLFAGHNSEPQSSGTTVRVLVAADADPADVVRVLRKLLAWAERDDAEVLHYFREAPPRPDPATPFDAEPPF